MTSSDPIVRSFYMKDLYDHGLAIVKNQPLPDSLNALSFLGGYTLMDDAVDADGKPNYDYHIWTGLARLLISAGDLIHAAVKVTVSSVYEDEPKRWFFSYDLGPEHGGEFTFIRLLPVPDTEGFQDFLDADMKKMGPIPTEEEYIPKLGAYPLMVNPAMGRRSTAALNFILAMALRQTGLLVTEHWIPEDTSLAGSEAVYLLSDGKTHYTLRYNGPALEQCLATLDAMVDRTEEDGAVILEPKVTTDADGLEATDDAEDIDAEEDVDLSVPHVDLTAGQLPH